MTSVFALFVVFLCEWIVRGKCDEPPNMNCLGLHCNHGCILRKSNRNFGGTCAVDNHECEGPKECHRPEDVNRGEGCCCKDDHCVFTITHPHQQVTCSDCPNVLRNDCHGYDMPCHDNEVCKVKKDHDVISTKCEETHRCADERRDDSQHGDQFKSTTCCYNVSCTYNSIHHSHLTTTHAPVVQTSTQAISLSGLQCPACTDGFTGSCSMTSDCAIGQDCMLQVRNGQLQTKCAAIKLCYLETLMHGNTVCCADSTCVGNTFRDFRNVNWLSSDN